MSPLIYFIALRKQFPYSFEYRRPGRRSLLSIVNFQVLNKLFVQIAIHIAAWACFLMLPIVFYPRLRDISIFSERYFSLFFVVNNVLIIGFYYLNTHLFIPKLLDQKKFVVYSLLILGLLIFYGSMPRIFHYFFSALQSPPPGAHPGRPRPQPLLAPGNIAIFMLVFVFSTGAKVINQWLRSEQKTKEIANEKLKAELSFLKAQINPHFLFNTLNNIYALASDQSEYTAPAVMKLSNIMRYMLTEAGNDLVPLEKEIQFTRHYIELQKMRLTGKSSIDFRVSGDPVGRQIAPLLFLPFVENAFKYGISTRELSPVTILLEIKKDSLYFTVSNHKHINASHRITDNTGIGINNTRRRLDLLYNDQYTLTINDEPASFTVHLNIQV